MTETTGNVDETEDDATQIQSAGIYGPVTFTSGGWEVHVPQDNQIEVFVHEDDGTKNIANIDQQILSDILLFSVPVSETYAEERFGNDGKVFLSFNVGDDVTFAYNGEPVSFNVFTCTVGETIIDVVMKSIAKLLDSF